MLTVTRSNCIPSGGSYYFYFTKALFEGRFAVFQNCPAEPGRVC